jgi:hypothetical protein
MTFRMLRSDALGAWEKLGVEGMVEYMVKLMGSRPGLGKERIFKQLGREYGANVEKKVEVFVKTTAKMRTSGTFLENMAGNMKTAAPQLDNFFQMR